MKSFGGKRVLPYVMCAVLVLSAMTPFLQPRTAYAAQITQRSLTLQANGNDGGSKPSGVVHHLFNFTVPTGGNVGSIRFQYCTIASGTCTTPAGLSTTSATLGSEGPAANGFSMVNTTQGAPYLSRTASSVSAGANLSYQLQNITNPSAVNYTFFVRIATYSSTDATGSPIDEGSVAASTANPIVLTGTMPESLIFCTAQQITAVGNIPDCTTATEDEVTFNQLFSPTDTATATSQMAASTNATNGYNITVAGTTMTSGSNTIPAMTTAAAGTRGVSQFGMNLTANTTTTSTPAVGATIAPASNGTDLRGQPATGYGTVDNFKFTSGDSVANSAYLTPGPTNSQLYTASYIVNVAGSQTAGTYTTTLTYICTATF